MSELFYYHIKVSICLAIVYVFYRLALRNLTFYNSNRWFLLIGSGLSFLLPLVSLFPFRQIKDTNASQSMDTLLGWNMISHPLIEAANKVDALWQSMSSLITILFCLGTVIQGSKLLIQLMAFFHILRSATLIEDGAIKVYQVDKQIAPFSFGNHIFLNTHLLKQEEIQQVITHEQVHVRQKHTIDVLWMECLLLFYWYNPFVWMLKAAVRENLEFIVDREVLTKWQSDRKSYQYLLLKIIGLSDLPIANPFNVSSLKTRIHMMNRKPSNRHALARYILVVPLFVFLAFTFCGRSMEETTSPDASLQNDRSEIPLSESFTAKNPTVKKLFVKTGNLIVELKSGKEEKYAMNDKTEMQQFNQQYGQLPPPPPPVTIKPLGNNKYVVEKVSGEQVKKKNMILTIKLMQPCLKNGMASYLHLLLKYNRSEIHITKKKELAGILSILGENKLYQFLFRELVKETSSFLLVIKII